MSHNSASAGLHQTSRCAQQGGFTAPRRADDADKFTARYFK
jgi:hypothetical protein